MTFPDFDRSFLRWVVRGSGSVGVFLLDSITRIRSVESNPVFFALTAGVLAGNMYTGGPLVKQPPYLYQVIVGDGAQRILRTGLPPKPDAAFAGNLISDSHGPSSEVFESLEVELCWKSNDCLRPVHPGMDAVGLGARLMGLATCVDGAGQAEVFFPIRHWNRLGSGPDFQVETGPVLWPRFLEDFSGGMGIHHLQPAFLHFASEKRVEVSLDYPYFRRLQRENLIPETHACQIRVYEIVS